MFFGGMQKHPWADMSNPVASIKKPVICLDVLLAIADLFASAG